MQFERERDRKTEREKEREGQRGRQRERERELTLQASSKLPGTCDRIFITISTGNSEIKSQY